MDVKAATRAFEDIMQRFVRCLGTRDVEGALPLFAEDVIWFGSAADEHAHGLAELGRFLGEDVFKRPYTVEWIWEQPLVAGSGNTAWFVAPTIAVVHYDDGTEQRLPYRMSGVMERIADERWVIRLFNGAEPAQSA